MYHGDHHKGKHIMGDISTCNSIREIEDIKLMNINKGWNYHCPRIFLIDFLIGVGDLMSL